MAYQKVELSSICSSHKQNHINQLRMDSTSKSENLDIETARALSLHTCRKSSSYRFEDLAIDVTTKPNDGIVGTYSSKCCFISIADGMINRGAKQLQINGTLVPLTALELLKLANFTDPTALLDTDNPTHQACLLELVRAIPQIQLVFYVGVQQNGKWRTTPDPAAVFGTGKSPIRILNMGRHFENILTGDDKFVDIVIEMDEKSTNSTTGKPEEKQENADHKTDNDGYLSDDYIEGEEILFKPGQIFIQTQITSQITFSLA